MKKKSKKKKKKEEKDEVDKSEKNFEIFQPKIPEKKISLFFNLEILETTKSQARKSSLENDESKSCPVTPLIKFKKYKQSPIFEQMHLGGLEYEEENNITRSISNMNLEKFQEKELDKKFT